MNHFHGIFWGIFSIFWRYKIFMENIQKNFFVNWKIFKKSFFVKLIFWLHKLPFFFCTDSCKREREAATALLLPYHLHTKVKLLRQKFIHEEKTYQFRAISRRVGQKIKQSPGQKNSWNPINQFHEKNFDQHPFFAISKMAKNQFLNLEKV